MRVMYVKTGLAGYGPELDTEDRPAFGIAAICDAIRWELDTAVDMLADEASMAKNDDDAPAYMAARELADELSTMAAQLDYRKRAGAPLYVDRPGLLDETMAAILDGDFPLDISTNGYSRLYVWAAPGHFREATADESAAWFGGQSLDVEAIETEHGLQIWEEEV